MNLTMDEALELTPTTSFELGQKQLAHLRLMANRARAAAKKAKFITTKAKAEGRVEALEAAIRLVERTT